jgi:DNA-binding transcriptional LysR family regulator
MVRFARAGLGTAIVPRSFTADLAAQSGRAAGLLDLADRGLTMTIGAYTRPDSLSPTARALLDIAAEQAELRGELPGQGTQAWPRSRRSSRNSPIASS